MTTQHLSGAQRLRVASAIERALRDKCPDLLTSEPSGVAGGWADLLTHLDELVDIVRRTSAERIEPYLSQILDDICSKCQHQYPSGRCSLRDRDLCQLYQHAPTIVRAIIGELDEMRDEGGPSCSSES